MNATTSKSGIAWAAVFAVGGITYAAWRPTSGSFLIMASMLLLAWNMAFTPGPRVSDSVRGVYEQARAGTFRTSVTAKLVALAATVLFVTGTYLNLTQ